MESVQSVNIFSVKEQGKENWNLKSRRSVIIVHLHIAIVRILWKALITM